MDSDDVPQVCQEEVVCDGEMEVPQMEDETEVQTPPIANANVLLPTMHDSNETTVIATAEQNVTNKTTQSKKVNHANGKTTDLLESSKSSNNKAATVNRKLTKKISPTKTLETQKLSKSPKPVVGNKSTILLQTTTGKATPIKNPTAGGVDDIDSPKPSTSKAAAAAANSKRSTPSNTPGTANAKKARKRRDSGTSSEEERWLNALESGKLLDVDDELKKMKDPKLMTARQRAMYDRNNDDDEPLPGVEMLLSLPSGYREKEKPQTAEEIQKAALKVQRRRQQADERRERDKKKTMERLLKKQESRQRSARNKNTKAAVPMIRYQNTLSGACIQMPPDYEFPLKAQTAREPPKRQICGIAGCANPKIYNCSKTNMPLCSFTCYRKNVEALRQIMC